MRRLLIFTLGMFALFNSALAEERDAEAILRAFAEDYAFDPTAKDVEIGFDISGEQFFMTVKKNDEGPHDVVFDRGFPDYSLLYWEMEKSTLLKLEAGMTGETATARARPDDPRLMILRATEGFPRHLLRRNNEFTNFLNSFKVHFFIKGIPEIIPLSAEYAVISHGAGALGLAYAPRMSSSGQPKESFPVEIYQRAEAFLPENLQQLVVGENLTPNWREDGAQFWYESETLDGYQYMFVDPDQKLIRPLVDRAAVMAVVSRLTGETYQENTFRLPGFQYDFENGEISFLVRDKRWIYSPEKDDLSEKLPEKVAVPGLSPNGRWRVFTSDYNLYIEDTKDGTVRQLTSDGSAMEPYARPIPHPLTILAQQTSNPEILASIAWSPDSKRFVTFQTKLEGATRLTWVQSTPRNKVKPIVYDYIYPLAGDKVVPTAQSFIFDAENGTRVAFDLPPEVILNTYGLRYNWTKDSKEITFFDAERGFKSVRLYAVNGETGQSRLFLEETDDFFINYYLLFSRYLEKSNAIFWTSDETGWRHAYLIGLDGKRTALTSGEWNYRGLAGSDATEDTFFITGGGREPNRDPYLTHLYRVKKDGTEITLLTPEAVDHRVSVSPDGRYFVDNMSLVNQPTKSVLRSTVDGSILMELQEADISALLATGYTLPEPFETVAADGETPIYGVIFRPINFDSAKSYPVVENIYAGPQQGMAPKSFLGGLSYRKVGSHAPSIAQLGFIVVQVDGRGTSLRGRKFLNLAYKNLFNVGIDDHVLAIQTLAEKYPYMDLSRVGIYGLSAGGFDTVRAMLLFPDFYKVGFSAAGNHDNRLNQAYWSELWMGYPAGDEYETNATHHWVHKLKGKLFLVNGELDESVPPMTSQRLVKALIEADKDFEYLVIPNATHFLDDYPYFVRRRWDFFVEELLDMEPPSQYQIGGESAQ